MLPARLDSGLLRLLAVIVTIAVVAAILNPGLPVVFLPALALTALASPIAYHRTSGDAWWKLPAVVFVISSAVSLAATFYVLAQK